MRESYRLSKQHLVNWSVGRNESLEIVFMYVGKRASPPAVGSSDEVGVAMQRLISTISVKAKA